MALVSVIIPTTAERASLWKGVKSCLSQRLSPRPCGQLVADDVEIVIALSPKQDKLTQAEILSIRGFARSLSERIIVVPSETPGVNAARNAGALAARGEFVCFIDDDCEMANENYLQQMVNLFSRWPSVQGIGGVYKSPRSASYLDLGYNLMIRLWLESKTGGHAEAADGFSSELIPTRQLVGGNACYRRQIFASGLYFRESIRWGGDETEFHLRLIDRGYVLALAPRLEVEHDSQNSIRKSLRRGLAHGMASGRLPTNLRRGHWQAMPKILKASHSERWNMQLWSAFAAFMIFHWPAFWVGRALEAGRASINQLLGGLNHGGLSSEPAEGDTRNSRIGLSFLLLGKMEAGHNSSAGRSHPQLPPSLHPQSSS